MPEGRSGQSNTDFGPRKTTFIGLAAPHSALVALHLPKLLDFATPNRGRPVSKYQTDAWNFAEAEFQSLELEGDSVLYNEVAVILSEWFPNIDPGGQTTALEETTELHDWLKAVFSPEVFPDIGINEKGKLFGFAEAVKHQTDEGRIATALSKAKRRKALYDRTRPYQVDRASRPPLKEVRASSEINMHHEQPERRAEASASTHNCSPASRAQYHPTRQGFISIDEVVLVESQRVVTAALAPRGRHRGHFVPYEMSYYANDKGVATHSAGSSSAGRQDLGGSLQKPILIEVDPVDEDLRPGVTALDADVAVLVEREAVAHRVKCDSKGQDMPQLGKSSKSKGQAERDEARARDAEAVGGVPGQRDVEYQPVDVQALLHKAVTAHRAQHGNKRDRETPQLQTESNTVALGKARGSAASSDEDGPGRTHQSPDSATRDHTDHEAERGGAVTGGAEALGGDAGQRDVRHQPVDVEALVHQAVTAHRAEHGLKRHRETPVLQTASNTIALGKAYGSAAPSDENGQGGSLQLPDPATRDLTDDDYDDVEMDAAIAAYVEPVITLGTPMAMQTTKAKAKAKAGRVYDSDDDEEELVWVYVATYGWLCTTL